MDMNMMLPIPGGQHVSSTAVLSRTGVQAAQAAQAATVYR
jgi:hypothetical protein